MLKTTLHRLFNSQHRTAVLPQVAINFPHDPRLEIRVAYLLYRSPVVKPDPHPLEVEMSYLISREFQRYGRNEHETLNHFMAERQESVDTWGRTNVEEIQRNFFGLELYQDAIKVLLQRYKPGLRVTTGDYMKVKELTGEIAEAGPPVRHTVNRQLADYLFLLVKDRQTDKWTLPWAKREPHESLRTTVERAIHTQHDGTLETYFWSNAPQAVLVRKPLKKEIGKKTPEVRTFFFTAAYLTGKPLFGKINPACSDHAWVTRNELRYYKGLYSDNKLYSTIMDIAPDARFETA